MVLHHIWWWGPRCSHQARSLEATSQDQALRPTRAPLIQVLTLGLRGLPWRVVSRYTKGGGGRSQGAKEMVSSRKEGMFLRVGAVSPADGEGTLGPPPTPMGEVSVPANM